VRDIVSGLVVFLLIAIAGYRVLGGWMLVMTLIPIGDAVVVLRSGGSKATAYGVHVATAVVMAVSESSCWRETCVGAAGELLGRPPANRSKPVCSGTRAVPGRLE
jgi:Domain of unknown function (DUF4267)